MIDGREIPYMQFVFFPQVAIFCGLPGDGVPGGVRQRESADRPAGGRPLPRGSHAAQVRPAARARVARVHAAARLRLSAAQRGKGREFPRAQGEHCTERVRLSRGSKASRLESSSSSATSRGCSARWIRATLRSDFLFAAISDSLSNGGYQVRKVGSNVAPDFAFFELVEHTHRSLPFCASGRGSPLHSLCGVVTSRSGYWSHLIAITGHDAVGCRPDTCNARSDGELK